MSDPGLADLLGPITAYQESALIGTAVETGVAEALAGGARDPEAVAAACGCDPRGVQALLSGLVAVGLAARVEEGYELTERGAPLASAHPRSVASVVRKEWFFYRVWAELPQAVRDGHARIAPWRERLAADPETSLEFLRALDDLAGLFGTELAELAGPCSGRLLDVGGGAGSHAAALVEVNPGLEATVLDLEPVGPLVAERHPDLGFVPGDLDEPRFGLPADDSWDTVLLANILHDHPADRCRALLAEAAALLRPGGALLIYDWIIDPDRAGPPPVALFTPMMLVENEGGFTWTTPEITAWLTAAGLSRTIPRGASGPISVLRATP
ncbi:MAG: methyltransferase domain-containing protein [Actinobacteria bacterium]|nr:methyltransferase domain-containing protein [Actinomycetota bacterium]